MNTKDLLLLKDISISNITIKITGQFTQYLYIVMCILKSIHVVFYIKRINPILSNNIILFQTHKLIIVKQY